MAKAGDILKAKSPTGQTIDLGKLSTWIKYGLGATFFFLVLPWGQRGAQEVNKRLPSNLQEHMDPITGEAKKAPIYDVI